MKSLRILSIDDSDIGMQQRLVKHLSSSWEIETVRSFKEGKERLRSQSFDVILLDRHLEPEGISGLDLIPTLRFEFPNVAIIILTFDTDFNGIPKAFSLGASDYIIKSPTEDFIYELQIRIPEAVKKFRINQLLQISQRESKFDDCPMIGNSKFIRGLNKQITPLAGTEHPILLIGRQGSGIRSIAELIWQLEKDCLRPFYHIDLARIPSLEVSVSLYGKSRSKWNSYESAGALLLANSGDLFIEGLDLLSPEQQSEFIHFIKNYQFTPIGSSFSIHSKIRIIASISKNPKLDLSSTFVNKELLELFNTTTIEVPDLDNRPEDIEPVAKYILDMRSAGQLSFTREAIDYLMSKKWIGNYDHLSSFISNAILFAENKKSDLITLNDLVRANPSGKIPTEALITIPTTREELSRDGHQACLEEAEKTYLLNALRLCNWDPKLMASQIGVSFSSIYRRLEYFKQHKLYSQQFSTIGKRKRGRKPKALPHESQKLEAV